MCDVHVWVVCWPEFVKVRSYEVRASKLWPFRTVAALFCARYLFPRGMVRFVEDYASDEN